jgi:hypothetical protein
VPDLDRPRSLSKRMLYVLAEPTCRLQCNGRGRAPAGDPRGQRQSVRRRARRHPGGGMLPVQTREARRGRRRRGGHLRLRRHAGASRLRLCVYSEEARRLSPRREREWDGKRTGGRCGADRECRRRANGIAGGYGPWVQSPSVRPFDDVDTWLVRPSFGSRN